MSSRWSAAMVARGAHLVVVGSLVVLCCTGAWAQQGALATLQARAAQGNAESQFLLGSMYSAGTVVDQDDVEAVRWFLRSAEQGYVQSFLPLADAYLSGLGTTQDFVNAHRWFNIAAARLSGEERAVAVEGRDRVQAQMTGSQLEEAQRLARQWIAAQEIAREPVTTAPEATGRGTEAVEPETGLGDRRTTRPFGATASITTTNEPPFWTDKRQGLVGFGLGRSDGLNSLGIGAAFAGFGDGALGGAFSFGFSKLLDIPSSAFSLSFRGGPLWRFKGDSRVTPHVGLGGGIGYVKVGRRSAVAPVFGLNLPLLIRMSDRASFAIIPGFSGVFYESEVGIGVSVNIGVAFDTGTP